MAGVTHLAPYPDGKRTLCGQPADGSWRSWKAPVDCPVCLSRNEALPRNQRWSA